MVTKRTTLIVGAGASYDFGFPLGSELRKRIIDNINQPKYYSEYRHAGFIPAEIEVFKQELITSDAHLTIDAIIGKDKRKYANIGKFGIAQVLLPLNRGFDFNKPIKNDWIKYLFERMTQNPEALEKNQLSIVTFNYDKMVEDYMYHLFTTKLPYINAPEKIELIKPIHVFGQLDGAREWEMTGWPRLVLRGDIIDHKDCHNSAIWMRTIHEFQHMDGPEHDINEQLQQAHGKIKDSENVLFIGFGFDELNVHKLKIKDLCSGKNVFGTAIGLTPEKKKEIETFSNGIIKPANLIDIDIKSLLTIHLK